MLVIEFGRIWSQLQSSLYNTAKHTASLMSSCPQLILNLFLEFSGKKTSQCSEVNTVNGQMFMRNDRCYPGPHLHHNYFSNILFLYNSFFQVTQNTKSTHFVQLGGKNILVVPICKPSNERKIVLRLSVFQSNCLLWSLYVCRDLVVVEAKVHADHGDSENVIVR